MDRMKFEPDQGRKQNLRILNLLVLIFHFNGKEFDFFPSQVCRDKGEPLFI